MRPSESSRLTASNGINNTQALRREAMRILLKVNIPVETGNAAAKKFLEAYDKTKAPADK